MDIIVRHARLLPPTLDVLDRAPRRTHEMIPLARAQEVDRRAMMWLIRQPGESIAERAGPESLAVAVRVHARLQCTCDCRIGQAPDLLHGVTRSAKPTALPPLPSRGVGRRRETAWDRKPKEMAGFSMTWNAGE